MLMLLAVVFGLLRLCSGMSLRPYVSHKGVRTNATHGSLSSATSVDIVDQLLLPFIHKISWI